MVNRIKKVDRAIDVGDTEMSAYAALLEAVASRLAVGESEVAVQASQRVQGRNREAMKEDFITRLMELPKGEISPSTESKVRPIVERFSKQFEEAYRSGNYATKSTPDGTFVRTPLLASPSYLKRVAAEVKAGNEVTFWPADPDVPEFPMTAERLLRQAGIMSAEAIVPQEGEGEGVENPIMFTNFVNKAFSIQLAHNLVSDSYGFDDVIEPVGEKRIQASASSIGDTIMQKMQGSGKRVMVPLERQIQKMLGSKLSSTYSASYAGIHEEAHNSMQRALAHAFDCQPITRQAYERCIKNDLVFPLAFVLCRPHMAYEMLMMIKCLAGFDMGRTIIKAGEFELEDDAKVHAHLGTYIWYSKAIVTDPRHVFVAQEVMANGRLGGSGIEAVNPDTYHAATGDSNGQSIFVLAVPYNYQLSGIFSMTGKLTLAEYEEYQLGEDDRVQYCTAHRYNRIYGWNNARLADDYDATGFDAMEEKQNNNVLCYQGHSWYYTPTEKQFQTVQYGSGHWGRDGTYIGCDQVRDGRLTAMNPPTYEKLYHA